MKKRIVLSVVVSICISGAWAQELPKKSAEAEVEQIVGLNEIEIEYSRPNVNDREIFGGLVPFGEVWRLGANSPTKISLEFPISINGQELKAGTYAMFAIPEKKHWTIVFNSDTEQWGASNYDEAKNVVTYQATVQKTNPTESLTIGFENVNESGAVLAISWDQVKVEVPFTTDTDKAVTESIHAAIKKGEKLGTVYFRAADYFFKKGDVIEAKSYLDKSLAIETTYSNTFLQANMMKSENLEEAKKLAEKAAVMAEEEKNQRWADYIRKSSATWTAK